MRLLNNYILWAKIALRFYLNKMKKITIKKKRINTKKKKEIELLIIF